MIEVNKVYNENCLNTMLKIPDNSIDLTVTSPPYNLGSKHHTNKNHFKSYDIFDDDMPENEYQDNQVEVLNELYRITKNDGSLFYNHKNRIINGQQISPYQWLLKTNWIIKQELIWWNGTPNFDKCRFYPMTERVFWLSKSVETKFHNHSNQSDILKDNPSGTKGLHKRAFPMSLVCKIIKNFAPIDLIYDPYMGSGTTALAAIKMKCNWIGSEISPDYTQLCLSNIEHSSKQKTLF